MAQILFRTTHETKRKLKILAASRGLYVSQLLGEIIEKFFEEINGDI